MIVVGVALVDQLTKLWATSYLSLGESVEVVGRFFMLTLIHNEGGALGTSFGSSHYYLVTSLLILLIVLYYIYAHRYYRTIALCLAFVAGGAVGNDIDRLRYGYVIDFLDFDIPDIHLFGFRLERWWTYNIADAAITCAIVFLLLWMLLARRAARDSIASEASPDQGGLSTADRL